LVELGRTLGLSIVAEGIETCSQLEGLRTEHCAYGQGFIFARPMTSDAVVPYLYKEADGAAAVMPQVPTPGAVGALG
jgi:EAL domain-containing protein (putative c-di-GMP-specific phosphodiesterase class I)